MFRPIGFAVWRPVSDWIGLDMTLVAAAAVVAGTKLVSLLVPEIRRMGRPAAVAAAA